jgi:protein TonB
VDTPPEILSRPEPIYPEPLRASGIEGSVVLSVVIDAQGRVEGIRLLSATHPGFVTSAIEYARGIRFRPALKGGQPVAVEVRLPVRFLLR